MHLEPAPECGTDIQNALTNFQWATAYRLDHRLRFVLWDRETYEDVCRKCSYPRYSTMFWVEVGELYLRQTLPGVFDDVASDLTIEGVGRYDMSKRSDPDWRADNELSQVAIRPLLETGAFWEVREKYGEDIEGLLRALAPRGTVILS